MSSGVSVWRATSATARPRTRRWKVPSTGPVRILGPCRSPSSATGRPTASAASRTLAAASRCASPSPCEKLRRATSMPAWIIALSVCGDELDGPMVQTMRVRRTWLTKAPPHLWGGGAKRRMGWPIFGDDRATSLVPLHAAAHLPLGVDDATLELQRADHGSAHPPYEVGLEAVRRRDRDHGAGLACQVRQALDRVVGRVAFAREDDPHAVDGLLGVGHGPGVMRVEDDRHLLTGDHAQHREAPDQLVARRLEGSGREQAFERRPGVDHVVAVNDQPLHA